MTKMASQALKIMRSPKFISGLIILTLLIAPSIFRVWATGFGIDLDTGILAGEDSEVTVTDIVLNVITYVVAAAGLIVVLFLIIGGMQYVTAHGNTELQERAKRTITFAIVGAIIVLISLVIVESIGALLTADTGIPGPDPRLAG